MTDFNQMSGRAGRDGRDARIILLYGGRDAHINEQILWAQAPARDDLATLYRALMTEDRRVHNQGVELNDADLLAQALSINARARLTEASVATGISVFEELGFCGIEGYGDGRRLRMVLSPGRVDLGSSLRYTEGVRALEEFATFRNWALTSLPQEMLERINRPITPDFGHTVD